MVLLPHISAHSNYYLRISDCWCKQVISILLLILHLLNAVEVGFHEYEQKVQTCEVHKTCLLTG